VATATTRDRRPVRPQWKRAAYTRDSRRQRRSIAATEA
jgi:hypothetical protein